MSDYSGRPLATRHFFERTAPTKFASDGDEYLVYTFPQLRALKTAVYDEETGEWVGWRYQSEVDRLSTWEIMVCPNGVLLGTLKIGSTLWPLRATEIDHLMKFAIRA